MSRASFFDPLYDYVTFEEAEQESQRDIFSPGWRMGSSSGSPKEILPFLSTHELSRLSFLRQSNLAFLVYPSATHTRFAHAIGCCYLGYMAANDIVLMKHLPGTRNERQLLLNQWLIERGWKEEFLLALLLHDIGHYAFSHALEADRSLWSAFGFELRHEDIAHQFLKGEGPVAEVFYKRCSGLGESKHVHELLAGSSEIEWKIISFLIRGEATDIMEFDSQQRVELALLHELTSGLLDLDRIDHYRRDSYFSGLRFASNLSFTPLLHGLSIWYDETHYEIRLSPDAVGQALTLLHAKERLVHDCFENPCNMAYEVMLGQAVNRYLFGNPHCEDENGDWIEPKADDKTRLIELLLHTDEELLIALEAGPSDAADLAHRIRNRDPFSLIERRLWSKGNINETELRRKIAQLAGVDDESIGIRTANGFPLGSSARPVEWLHLDSLFDHSGRKLDRHEEYKRQIQHFKAVQEDVSPVFWVFSGSKDAAVQEKIRSALTRLGDV